MKALVIINLLSRAFNGDLAEASLIVRVPQLTRFVTYYWENYREVGVFLCELADARNVDV